MKELELLLDNYWMIKDENKELYYRVKDALPNLKSFLNEKLGYHIIVTPELIKLEKLPGKAESWMGIADFDDIMEYAFLCLLLMFLEDKSREDQFVLSQVTEFMQANFISNEKIDWTLFRHRRYLIKVLRFATSIGIIKVDDGDDQDFANNASSEILYESTGFSRYFVRNFTTSILGLSSYTDLEASEFSEISQDRGFIRRNRVYRRIVMSPVLYNEGADDADYGYIKQQRGLLEKDMEQYLDCDFHVHRNGAMLVVGEGRSFSQTFPESKAISDIVLQMNYILCSEITSGKISLNADDTAVVSMATFTSFLLQLKNDYSIGWSKEYREMSQDALLSAVIKYMDGFCMLTADENENKIILLPLIGKITGSYPDGFNTDPIGLKEE